MVKSGHSGPSLDELTTFCKRKGFIYPSSEIYGGLAGFYDYGSLGSLLKRHFEDVWRGFFLGLGDNFSEIQASEIMHEKTFEASGHLKNFTDFVALCEKGHSDRADHLLEKKTGKRCEGMTKEELMQGIDEHDVRCSTCGLPIVSVEVLNMMFPLQLGIGAGARGFLRPETAQSPYVNFLRQFEFARKKLPFAVALVGKAYRNEISPRNFTLRQRAFTQAELQIFFNSAKIAEHEDFDSVKNVRLRMVLAGARSKEIQEIKASELVKKLPQFYVYHLAKVQEFYLSVLHIPAEKFRFYELDEKERAFYNKYHFDIECDLGSLGWVEMGGVHYRTDHDLKGHQEVSKQSMMVHDDSVGEKVLPHVLELSFGVDRNLYLLLHNAYTPDKERENTILKLTSELAPYQAAIFPLITKGKSYDLARQVYQYLRKKFSVSFDVSGSIGKRYARQDENGTPYCITVDEDSLKDKAITIRERDSTKQVRVKIDDLPETLRKLVRGELDFGKAGKAVSRAK